MKKVLVIIVTVILLGMVSSYLTLTLLTIADTDWVWDKRNLWWEVQELWGFMWGIVNKMAGVVIRIGLSLTAAITILRLLKCLCMRISARKNPRIS